ncbi:hypothetical protein BCR37DRAFT_382644 [Protomyces lactucae-debilis]|uniref:Uncharacterized protein n=1 Tax=Protomyces lactucae-debilis TaxID=2754530 RepID=A0A1Y2F1J7_PROLT|nr:uncharacterized protein BCR37DRAFT_382644 [Protomyces lactucae-debilis]ORY77748.1 hypothetical protein BCR37DRAFT_382644 [Protomyces lactucae-debilis]
MSEALRLKASRPALSLILLVLLAWIYAIPGTDFVYHWTKLSVLQSGKRLIYLACRGSLRRYAYPGSHSGETTVSIVLSDGYRLESSMGLSIDCPCLSSP